MANHQEKGYAYLYGTVIISFYKLQPIQGYINLQFHFLEVIEYYAYSLEYT